MSTPSRVTPPWTGHRPSLGARGASAPHGATAGASQDEVCAGPRATLLGAPSTYDTRFLGLILGILALSFADAALTLTLMATGQVREWNPFLAALIERDLQLFANVKMGLTAAGVLVLAGMDGARLRMGLPVRRIMQGVLLVYCLVTLYHLTLLHWTGLMPG